MYIVMDTQAEDNFPNSGIIDIKSRIIFDQDGLLVLNKPYNLPTSGRNLDDDDCLQYWLMQHEEEMIWVIHQLDADTTGLNLFVREKKLVKKYHHLLAHSSKLYLAIVHGSVNWQCIDVKEPIGKVDERNMGVTEKGKNAHTRFTCLDKNEDFSLIQAEIFTGRTHQIRIHASHLGHSLVGEEWYIAPPCNLHPRQALHAWKVQLGRFNLTAPLAKDFEKLMHKLKLKNRS